MPAKCPHCGKTHATKEELEDMANNAVPPEPKAKLKLKIKKVS